MSRYIDIELSDVLGENEYSDDIFDNTFFYNLKKFIRQKYGANSKKLKIECTDYGNLDSNDILSVEFYVAVKLEDYPTVGEEFNKNLFKDFTFDVINEYEFSARIDVDDYDEYVIDVGVYTNGLEFDYDEKELYLDPENDEYYVIYVTAYIALSNEGTRKVY